MYLTCAFHVIILRSPTSPCYSPMSVLITINVSYIIQVISISIF